MIREIKLFSRNLESDNEFDEKSPGNSIHSIE